MQRLLCLLAILGRSSPSFGSPVATLSKTAEFLGPFPVGRTELDGDPCEAAGGIMSLYNSRQFPTRSTRIVSELVPGAMSRGTRYEQEPQTATLLSPPKQTGMLLFNSERLRQLCAALLVRNHR